MSIVTILVACILSVTGIWNQRDSSLDGNWDELALLPAAKGYDAA